MTKEELSTVLPDVLTTARTWVARINPTAIHETRAESGVNPSMPKISSSRMSQATTLVSYRPQ
jgi:hypothetical protein